MELPMGPRNVEGRAEISCAGLCGLRRQDLRWSSPWGHETCEGCAEMGAVCLIMMMMMMLMMMLLLMMMMMMLPPRLRCPP